MKPINLKKYLPAAWRTGVPALVALFFCGAAQALPWEGPLETLQTSLTGPVAKAIGVIALAASGGMLAFGGELSEFTKRMMMVVLALSVMLLASSFMSMFSA
jgi:type IV secretion system protein VirB2